MYMYISDGAIAISTHLTIVIATPNVTAIQSVMHKRLKINNSSTVEIADTADQTDMK